MPFQGEISNDELMRTQRERWNQLIDKGREAAVGARCVCIGDLNLDYKHWNSLNSKHSSMIEKLKNAIESMGFRPDSY